MNKQFLLHSIRTAVFTALVAIPGLSCTYSVSVPAIPASGGLVYVSINTQHGCAWTLETSEFLSYYSARTGTGRGTAILFAQPNLGAARSTRISLLYTGYGVIVEDSQQANRPVGDTVAWTVAIQY